MRIGHREFDTDNNTYIMGILNITPDSFSDGGKYNDMDKALFRVEEMIRDGADIIDVGGESTRPGYVMISDEEEIYRILPVVEKIRADFDTVISVDTYKSRVAKEAAQSGADMINDIWGCRYDDEMANVIAESNLACCLMHNRDLDRKPYMGDVVDSVIKDMQESIDIALSAGVRADRIITDPGIGFGKTLDDNLLVMNHLEELGKLGYPLLLGTSRKSMIGLTLNLPKEDRLDGTIATTVVGVMKGCAFIRVHDIQPNKRAVLMTRAIMDSGNKKDINKVV